MRLRTTEVLDDAVRVVKRMPLIWPSLLVLALLPFRFLEVLMVNRLMQLGSEAGAYGSHLGTIAAANAGGFLVASIGRLWFVRASALTLRGDAMATAAIRIAPHTIANYVYLALLFHFLCLLFVPVGLAGLVAWPFLFPLAAATAHLSDRPGLVAPIRNAGRFLKSIRVPIALVFVYAIAFPLAVLNLSVLGSLGVWLSKAVPGVDAVGLAVRSSSDLYVSLLIAGALTLLEPFYLASWVVYVERSMERDTGEDLRTRFRHIRNDASNRSHATVAAIVIAALGAIPMFAAERVSLAEYRTMLTDASAAVERNDYASASSIGRRMRETVVASGDDTFAADPSLARQLEELSAKSEPTIALRLRLDALRNALGEPAPDDSLRSDSKLLESLRERSRLEALERGGTVARTPAVNESLLDRLLQPLKRLAQALADFLAMVLDWIVDLWPSRSDERPGGSMTGTFVLVTVLLVVAIVIVVAIRVMRGSTSSIMTLDVESTPVSSSRKDDDPLSRESAEWQAYAAQLASEGRYREAIRAWYHAVLVALYRGGLVHYRQGRTNWEYLSALPPSLPWRSRFAVLTREFDREWYGRHDASDEVLDRYAADARGVLADLRRSGK